MPAVAGRVRTGKYLAFALSGEMHGIDSMRVISIIGDQPCIPLPQAPRHVRGLTMIRGKVVPVIDIRRRLGLAERETTDETCIIIVSVNYGQAGIRVDGVHEVLDIFEEQFDHLIDEQNGDEMIGVAKLKKGLVTVLDIDSITRGS